MPETPRRSALARSLVLPVLWVATAAWMAVAYARDPYDPESTHRYGHNGEGALATGIAVTLVELLVLLAVLRPWKPGPTWGRLVVALGLLVPWAFFSAMMTMHAGSVIMIHLVWVAALVVVLGCALAASAVRAMGQWAARS